MKNQTLYMATIFDERAEYMAQTVGLTPDPRNGFVPLCTTQEGAVARYLQDAKNNGKIDPKKIKTVFLFAVEVPEDLPALDPQYISPELEKYSFVSYKGTLAPEYIKECFVVDLYDADRKPGEPTYNVNTMFFAVEEKEMENVEKNGFTSTDVYPGGPPGVALLTTIPDAVAIYADIYQTKKNGIKSLAVFGAKFPPHIRLESEGKLKGPDGEEMRFFLYNGKIPPEYITGVTVVDLKPGGRFA